MLVRLGLLGFGNVLREFVGLLHEKAPTLQKDYDLEFRVVGVATRSRGIAINPEGLSLSALQSAADLSSLHLGEPVADTQAFIAQVPADMILEATLLNPQTGQPALDLVRAALEQGKHVVTANKGPVAFGYHQLQALAAEKDLGFFYEATVMDGLPVHSLRREGLPAAEVLRIRGVLNSTTNLILTQMEKGKSFDDAVREAQARGVAETDPSNDVDGWDAAIKIAILANIFMGADLRPVDVQRQGIREISPSDLQAALQAGQRIKLVCEAVRQGGRVQATVQPLQLPQSDPLAQLEDTASAVSFETDILERLTLIEGDAGPRTTAYGMLVDALNIARGRR